MTFLRALGNALNLASLAIVARWTQEYGSYTVDSMWSESRYHKLDATTLLSLAAWSLENGICLEYAHVRVARMVGVGHGPVSPYQHLALVGVSPFSLYKGKGWDRKEASLPEMDKLARRVMRALAPLKLTSADWRAIAYGISSRARYDEVMALVKGFRKVPALMERALRSPDYVTFPPERIKLFRRCYRAVRVRLKYAEDSASMRRFVRWLFERHTSSYNPLPDSLGEVINTWRAYNGDESEKPSRNDNANRRADRRASRNMEANAIKHGDSFRRGKALGDLAYHVCEALATESRSTGAPVVVYGRDCEVFYKLLKEFYPDVATSYVLAPRPLTTGKGKPTSGSDYDKYLRRHIPANAIHFDSGFAGSIIVWIRDNLGIPVHSVRLISCDVPGFELFGRASKSSRMRTIVLDDIEHVAHRLVESNENAWRAWQFSDDCERFWARLHGMRVAMTEIRSGARAPLTIEAIAGISVLSANDDNGACECYDCKSASNVF